MKAIIIEACFECPFLDDSNNEFVCKKDNIKIIGLNRTNKAIAPHCSLPDIVRVEVEDEVR